MGERLTLVRAPIKIARTPTYIKADLTVIGGLKYPAFCSPYYCSGIIGAHHSRNHWSGNSRPTASLQGIKDIQAASQYIVYVVLGRTVSGWASAPG